MTFVTPTAAMRKPFPRAPLVGAAVMILVALGVAAAGHRGESTARPVPASERFLRFADQRDGGIDVTEGARVVDALAPQTNGFLRSTLRGLVRERRRRGIGADAPFRLFATRDGQIVLEDPATGRSIDLNAFGPTNAEAFARLLPPVAPAT